LALPQHLALGTLRLLHLDDHFSARKYFLRCVDNFGPGIAIFIVRQPRPNAGRFLNNYPVAPIHEFRNAGGRQADSKFVVFGFFWRAN
jgi:hypothetical protein